MSSLRETGPITGVGGWSVDDNACRPGHRVVGDEIRVATTSAEPEP